MSISVVPQKNPHSPVYYAIIIFRLRWLTVRDTIRTGCERFFYPPAVYISIMEEASHVTCLSFDLS